jgi:hypothetical protein
MRRCQRWPVADQIGGAFSQHHDNGVGGVQPGGRASSGAEQNPDAGMALIPASLEQQDSRVLGFGEAPTVF